MQSQRIPGARRPNSLTRVRDAVAYFEELDSKATPGFMEVLGAISAICSEVERAEQEGVDARLIRKAVGGARTIHGRSTFIRRLQEWPRGYPGDFETIDMLLDAPISTAPDTLERHCERYAYDCGAAQQHRNKIQWQARAILEVARHYGPDGRILILACGGARDVQSVLPALRSMGCPEIILNDADPAALAISEARLLGLSGHVRAEHGNALRLVRRRDLGQFDLVVLGGLADYLTDRQVAFLVRTARNRLLRPRGRLILTNIARGNPFRAWIEYLASWQLVERDSEQLVGLVEGDCEVRTDRSGLSLLVEVAA